MKVHWIARFRKTRFTNLFTNIAWMFPHVMSPDSNSFQSASNVFYAVIYRRILRIWKKKFFLIIAAYLDDLVLWYSRFAIVSHTVGIIPAFTVTTINGCIYDRRVASRKWGSFWSEPLSIIFSKKAAIGSGERTMMQSKIMKMLIAST